MDTFTSTHSIVQMSDNNLSPAAAVTLKKHYNDHREKDEVDENQQNNGLKRQHSSECVHEISTSMKNNMELPSVQLQNGSYEQKVRKLETDVRMTSPSNDNRNGDGCDANFLTKFCESHNQRDGYCDTPISSDLSDAEIQLSDDKSERKMSIADTILLIGNGMSNGGGGASDMRSDRVIIKGHRRTRAHSTDSIQTDCYDTRKQLRLQTQNSAESEVSVF